jgi:hypothetical protein
VFCHSLRQSVAARIVQQPISGVTTGTVTRVQTTDPLAQAVAFRRRVHHAKAAIATASLSRDFCQVKTVLFGCRSSLEVSPVLLDKDVPSSKKLPCECGRRLWLSREPKNMSQRQAPWDRAMEIVRRRREREAVIVVRWHVYGY